MVSKVCVTVKVVSVYAIVKQSVTGAASWGKNDASGDGNTYWS